MGVERKKSMTRPSVVTQLFIAVLEAVTDDPTGHLPNCGYTNEEQVCGCSAMGERLHRALTEQVEMLGL